VEADVMGDLLEQLRALEEAVRRATEALARLQADNTRLKREVKRLEDERRQVLVQVDAILKDIGKLDLEPGG
jgi:cell division protein FtsB